MNEPIKTEFFINEFNIEMRKDTYLDAYGKEVTVILSVDAPESIEPKPTQLDRIESMVAKSQEEIAQEARDAYTLELINSGII